MNMTRREGDLQHTTISNCQIRYLRSGSGRPLVLLHTLRTQLDYFLPLLRELDQGFDVVVPDLPGHGESSAPPVAYTATYFTKTMRLHWQSWFDARAAYSAIRLPFTLVYGESDWSRVSDREANVQAIPDARSLRLTGCGHFSSLEEPQQVAHLIREAEGKEL